MIAADSLAALAHRRAAEFSAPDHEGVFSHPALFEIEDESGARLIDVLADLFEVAVEVLAGTAGSVPGGVVKLHEARAAFEDAAGEQTVLRTQEGLFPPKLIPAHPIVKPSLSEG